MPSYTVDIWSLVAGIGLGILVVFALVAVVRTFSGKE